MTAPEWVGRETMNGSSEQSRSSSGAAESWLPDRILIHQRLRRHRSRIRTLPAHAHPVSQAQASIERDFWHTAGVA